MRCNQMKVLIQFFLVYLYVTYCQVFNTRNIMSAPRGAGTTYPSGAPQLITSI